MMEAEINFPTGSVVTGAMWGNPPKITLVPLDIKEDERGIYHLFAWDDYEGQGGLNDHYGVFPTIGALMVAFAALGRTDNAQIVTVDARGQLSLYRWYGDLYAAGVHYVGWHKPEEQ